MATVVNALPRSTLPLRHRLPNPPPVFVGRAREMDALLAAMQRAPVAVLSGPGGIGKTALALALCPRLAGFDPERALLIDLRPAKPAEDPRVQIVRVLARALGVDSMDWSDVLRDDDTLGATLIDLAETGAFVVVLDDVHHVEPPGDAALLALLGRHARRSRWIITTRAAPPTLDLAPQTVTLHGLSDDALHALAAAFIAELSSTERDAAVSASGGSPWRLQQFLAAPGGDDSDDRLLGGLSAAQRTFLDALAPIDKALPLEALASFTTAPLAEVLPPLERRGLLQRGYGGYRIHDVVRRLLKASAAPHDGEGSLRAARPLAAQRDLESVLEGLRLLLQERRVDEVAARLDDCGERLLSDGFAPRLWQLLDTCADERLGRWRYRCAVVLGQPSLLARLTAPTGGSVDDRLHAARGLLVQGQLLACLDVTTALHAEAAASGDGVGAFRAGMVAIDTLTRLLRYTEAQALLAHTAPYDAASRVEHRAVTAFCLAVLGRADEAVAHAREVRREVDALPPEARAMRLHDLANVLFVAGDPREAHALVRAVVASSLAHYDLLYALALFARHAGHNDEAEAVVERLRPFLAERPQMRRQYAVIRAYQDFTLGRLATLGATIDQVTSEMNPEAEVSWHRALLRLQVLYRMAMAEPPPTQDTTAHGPKHMRYVWRWRARAGEAVAPSCEVVAPGLRHIGFDDAHDCVTWVEALLASGRALEALDRCEAALATFRHCGWETLYIEAQHLRCDILAVLGRWDALALAADELHTLATSASTPRYVTEARFFQAVVRADAVDRASLEQLATRIDTAPIAARRARHLLGDDARLDAIDRAVLAALATQRGVGVAEVRRDVAGTRCWGLDDAGRSVWRDDGVTVGLAERPLLWRLLVALYERGCRASKETLVRALWQEAEYHPLRHDNRLQVTVAKLRRRIENDATRPTLLVTTEEGYALAGTVRRVTTRQPGGSGETMAPPRMPRR